MNDRDKKMNTSVAVMTIGIAIIIIDASFFPNSALDNLHLSIRLLSTLVVTIAFIRGAWFFIKGFGETQKK